MHVLDSEALTRVVRDDTVSSSLGRSFRSGSDDGYETPMEDFPVDLDSLVRETGSINADMPATRTVSSYIVPRTSTPMVSAANHVSTTAAVTPTSEPVITTPSDSVHVSAEPSAVASAPTTTAANEITTNANTEPSAPVPAPIVAEYIATHRYATASEQAARMVEQYCMEGESDGWAFFNEKASVKMYRKTVPGSSADFLKGVGIIEASPERIKECTASLEDRKLWDDMFESGESVEQLDDRTDIACLRFKGMWLVSGRDMCVVRSWKKLSNGSMLLFSMSVEHPSCPVNKKYVRAKLYPTGFLLTPNADGTTNVVYVCAMDVMGSIPGKIKSMVSVSLPMTVDKIRRFMRTHHAHS